MPLWSVPLIVTIPTKIFYLFETACSLAAIKTLKQKDHEMLT